MKAVWWLVLTAGLCGCVDKGQQRPNQALVCTVNGKETYRSPLSGFWMYYDGVWSDQGWRHRYKPSMLESCYTEDAPP